MEKIGILLSRRKNVKKVFTITLALLLAFSLFACAKTTTPSPSPSASVSKAPSPSASASASASPGASPGASASPGAKPAEVGFFDPSIDYTKQKNYKVAYLYSGTSALYDMFSKAFALWATRTNCTYNDYSTSDADTFVSTIQTYADQGYNGLLVDPDSTIYSRVSDLLTDLKMPWMGCMAPPLDADGKLIHPNVGFDNYAFGNDMFQWCIDYGKANWQDMTADNTGGMFIGYSVVPVLELRHNGAHDNFIKNGFAEKNFYFLDGVTGQMDAQTAYDLSSATMSAHPDIKYWIGCGFFDEYSVGIARAADAAGKAANVVCSTAGGTSLINQWDAGEENSWKSAIYTDQRLYAEPIFNGLYAMMSGKASAESLWPEWVNHSKGDKYASLQLPSTTITKDMYKDYLCFVDKYTGIPLYEKYGVANPKTYPTTKEVPASYKA
jgi:ABC-type sugar transport system substrate-binding protein